MNTSALRYLGVLIIVIFSGLLIYEFIFTRGARTCQGKITNITTTYSNGTKNTNSHYIVSFIAEDGKEYVATGSGSFFSSKGDMVTVLYNPQDPSDNLVSSSKTYLMLLIPGGLFLVLSFVKWGKRKVVD